MDDGSVNTANPSVSSSSERKRKYVNDNLAISSKGKYEKVLVDDVTTNLANHFGDNPAYDEEHLV